MMSKKFTPEQKLDAALAFVVLIVIASFLLNNLLINYNFQKMVWAYTKTFPAETPFGIDYRDGWYNPATQLLQGKPASSVSQYPPFVSVLAVPLAALFSEQTGYFIQVGIICILTIASIYLSIRLVMKLFPFGTNSDRTELAGFVLFLAFAFYHLVSYGFTFSIERGNYDIYALFFSLLFLNCLVSHPEKVWLQVIWLSIAIHLKLYPAILILPLFWKHKGKAILPVLLVNAALLLILGPAEAIGFFHKITSTIQSPPIAIVNHSTNAFVVFLMDALAKSGATIPQAGRWIIRLIPLAIFGVECLWLLPGGYTSEKAVWLFICSVPLMNMLPSVSFDYKLILLTFPMLMFAYLLIRQSVSGRDTVLPAVLGVLTAVIAFYLARSYAVTPEILQNKWIFIFLLQVVMGVGLVGMVPNRWLTFSHRKQGGASERGLR
jgi:hypothetical protein